MTDEMTDEQKRLYRELFQKLNECLEKSPQNFEAELENALLRGFPVDFRGPSGTWNTLLADSLRIDGAANMQYGVTEMLLEAGADVNVKCGIDGANLPLSIAFSCGRCPIPVLEEIILAGVDVNSKNKYGKTIFDTMAELAIRGRIPEAGVRRDSAWQMLQLLLDYGADPYLSHQWQDPYKYVGKERLLQLKEMERLCEAYKGYDGERRARRAPLQRDGGRRRRRLNEAIQMSKFNPQQVKLYRELHKELVGCIAAGGGPQEFKARLEAALEDGFPVDFREPVVAKKTLLLESIERGAAEISEILLDNGADPDTADKDGNRPLARAVFYMLPEKLLKRLLDEGADPNKQNVLGETPFYEAAWKYIHGITEKQQAYGQAAARLLFDAGASPSQCDYWRETSRAKDSEEDLRLKQFEETVGGWTDAAWRPAYEVGM